MEPWMVFPVYWAPCSELSRSVVSEALQAPLPVGILQARILERVARASSQAWDGTQVSHTAGGVFTVWASPVLHIYKIEMIIIVSFP